MKYFYRYNLNKDRRDEIVFGKAQKNTFGGINYFDDLSCAQLKTLVEENFAHKTGRHNAAPTIGAILKMMEKYSEYVFADGYLIYPEREDYRISITHLHAQGDLPATLIKDFFRMTKNAEDFTIQKDKLEACWD